MLSRRMALTTLAAGPLLLTAACGTTDPAAPDRGQPSAGGSGAGGAEPITVTDGRGEEVTLPGPASKVVALEWSSVENVVTLGVQPVGVADIEGFRSWNTSVELTGDPTDVGLRGEPSIEGIASLAPDLIVGDTTSIPDTALEQMAEIAPIALFKGGDAEDQLGMAKDNFTTMATLLGKDDTASEVWSAFETHLDDAAANLTEAGVAEAPYLFVYANITGADISFRVHTEGSQPGAVAAKMGLENAWTGEGDAEWGLATADLEGLTTIPDDTRILYWGNDTEEDPISAQLGKNAIWTGLPSVEKGLVARAGDGIWMYGGPASMTQWADDLVRALTSIG